MSEEQMPSAEIERAETAGQMRTREFAWGYDPERDFRNLALEATYYSKGFRLISKDSLINVPHVIIGVTYRKGFTSESGRVGDYVSIEAVTADKETLSTNPIKHMLPNDLEVWPNESVVYNDGGTGIRRTLTQLFHSVGLINVGKPKHKDENPYDKPMYEWLEGKELAEDGIVADADGVKFRYVAMRGLRKSEYESPFGPAVTYYIA